MFLKKVIAMFNGQFPIKVLKKASAALAKLEQMRSKSAGSAFGETSKRSEDVWKKKHTLW